MDHPQQPTPTSRLRFGLARTDITPPVGIYHPMWGAARHHRATGIHRPLTAEVMTFGPLHEEKISFVRVQMDMVGLSVEQDAQVKAAAAQGANLTPEQIVVTYSHTHSGGLFLPDRRPLPGGEMIDPHLEQVYAHIEQAAAQAAAAMQPATITYAVGHCDMAANRDFWDAQNGLYACGFNPEIRADDTVLVARITGSTDELLAVVVNYACHPTSLAWENTQISPDYVGALREVVEAETGALCIFALGPCGDLGARQGHQGNLAVADANGRQVGYAALSALTSLGPPAADFVYQGPVISGATLGAWAYQPQTEPHQSASQDFVGGTYTVELPLKPRPDGATLQAEMADWLQKQAAADTAGEAIAARDYGARAERARRWLQRIQHLPQGGTFPFPFTVHRLGDVFWVTTAGEPYNLLQTEIRRRFSSHVVMISPMAGAMQVAYLLPREKYGVGLYQEEPSILAQGCLEILIDAICARMQALVD